MLPPQLAPLSPRTLSYSSAQKKPREQQQHSGIFIFFSFSLSTREWWRSNHNIAATFSFFQWSQRSRKLQCWNIWNNGFFFNPVPAYACCRTANSIEQRGSYKTEEGVQRTRRIKQFNREQAAKLMQAIENSTEVSSSILLSAPVNFMGNFHKLCRACGGIPTSQKRQLSKFLENAAARPFDFCAPKLEEWQ